MSRASYVILAIAILVASVAVVGWSFFGLGTSKNLSQQTGQATQSGQVSTRPRVPVNIEAAAVKRAVVEYTFGGKIVEVKNNPAGKEILTNIKTKAPRFIINNETKVFKVNEGQGPVAVDVSSIAPNQQVRIISSYNLKTKTWTTERVNVISSSLTTAPTTQ